MEWYRPISLTLFGMLFVYKAIGLLGYRKHPLLWPVFIVATPIAFVVHSVGALWGIVSPVETFEVTEKVTPETIEQRHDGLAAGDLPDHDGTERLVREDEGAFVTNVFDD